MTQGIHGSIVEDGRERPCLLIGQLVPRLHHADGIPVYQVVQHRLGTNVQCADGVERRLLAYPADWPGPKWRGGRHVYARHPDLPFNAPLPIFDEEPNHGPQ